MFIVAELTPASVIDFPSANQFQCTNDNEKYLFIKIVPIKELDHMEEETRRSMQTTTINLSRIVVEMSMLDKKLSNYEQAVQNMRQEIANDGLVDRQNMAMVEKNRLCKQNEFHASQVERLASDLKQAQRERFATEILLRQLQVNICQDRLEVAANEARAAELEPAISEKVRREEELVVEMGRLVQIYNEAENLKLDADRQLQGVIDNLQVNAKLIEDLEIKIRLSQERLLPLVTEKRLAENRLKEIAGERSRLKLMIAEHRENLARIAFSREIISIDQFRAKWSSADSFPRPESPLADSESASIGKPDDEEMSVSAQETAPVHEGVSGNPPSTVGPVMMQTPQCDPSPERLPPPLTFAHRQPEDIHLANVTLAVPFYSQLLDGKSLNSLSATPVELCFEIVRGVCTYCSFKNHESLKGTPFQISDSNVRKYAMFAKNFILPFHKLFCIKHEMSFTNLISSVLQSTRQADWFGMGPIAERRASDFGRLIRHLLTESVEIGVKYKDFVIQSCNVSFPSAPPPPPTAARTAAAEAARAVEATAAVEAALATAPMPVWHQGSAQEQTTFDAPNWLTNCTATYQVTPAVSQMQGGHQQFPTVAAPWPQGVHGLQRPVLGTARFMTMSQQFQPFQQGLPPAFQQPQQVIGKPVIVHQQHMSTVISNVNHVHSTSAAYVGVKPMLGVQGSAGEQHSAQYVGLPTYNEARQLVLGMPDLGAEQRHFMQQQPLAMEQRSLHQQQPMVHQQQVQTAMQQQQAVHVQQGVQQNAQQSQMAFKCICGNGAERACGGCKTTYYCSRECQVLDLD